MMRIPYHTSGAIAKTCFASRSQRAGVTNIVNYASRSTATLQARAHLCLALAAIFNFRCVGEALCESHNGPPTETDYEPHL